MASSGDDIKVDWAVGFVWTWKKFEDIHREAGGIEGFSLVQDEEDSFFYKPLKKLDLEDKYKQVMPKPPEPSNKENEKNTGGLPSFASIKEEGVENHERVLIGSYKIDAEAAIQYSSLIPEEGAQYLNSVSAEGAQYSNRMSEARYESIVNAPPQNPIHDKSRIENGYAENKSESVQFRLVACDADNEVDWGLYRIDIICLQDNKSIQRKSAAFFQQQLHRIKEKINIDSAKVMMGIDDAFEIELGFIQVCDDVSQLDDAVAVSKFIPPQSTNLEPLAIHLQGHHLQIHTKNPDNHRQKLLTYAADEYANMLQRIIAIGGIEVSSRRVEHIRQSIDRHLPLIERLQAMQRRLEHDCHALKRWWYQLRGKVAELFHIVVDSTNDLSMELEQNTRRINKKIDQALRENTLPFYLLGDVLPWGQKASLTRYMARGGVYHDKIVAYRENINARLEGDRSVLDKVSSLVDASDQRATNRTLNRVQTWGALLASVAIFTGLMGNFSLDGVNYLTDVILKSTSFAWLGTASFVGLLFYGLRLLWRKGHEERIERLVLNIIVPAILIGPIFWLYLQDFFVSMSAWLETNSMYEGVPLIYGITYFFVVFSVLLLLRQKDLQSWLMLRRNLSEDAGGGAERRSILRVEGEILDAYEKFFQKKTCVGNEADKEAIGQLKDNWQYLAEAMDDIDAEKHKEKQAKGSFREQVSSIRDEVLLARSISQCILRLPEHIEDLKNPVLAEHVMLRANIDFDPMPNKQKIRMIHEGTLLPAYLAPYSMDAYCRFSGKKPDELKDAVIKALMESICLYGDSKTLNVLADVITGTEGDLSVNIPDLRRRLERHMSSEWIDVFWQLIKKKNFVLSDVSDANVKEDNKTIEKNRKKHEHRINAWLNKYEYHASPSEKQDTKEISQSLVLFTSAIGVELFLHRQGKYAKAEEHSKKRYERLKENKASASRLAAAGRNIAISLRSQKKYGEASEYFELALGHRKKAEDLEGTGGEKLIRLFYELGVCYHRNREYENAKEKLEQVTQLREIKETKHAHETIKAIMKYEKPSEVVSILIRSRNELAKVHLNIGDEGCESEAEELYDKALALAEDFYDGKPHIDLIRTVEEIASFNQRLFQEAIQEIKADSGTECGFEDVNSNAQDCIRNSEKMYRRALEMRKKQPGSTDASIFNVQVLLLQALFIQGKFDELEVIATQHLKLTQEIYGDCDPRVLQALHMLAYSLVGQKKYKDAEDYYRKKLALQKKIMNIS